MKKTKNRIPSFALSSITGTWESINLNPTVIIYRDGKRYLLSVIHINETSLQASPATYEIQKEDKRYFIVQSFKCLYLDYDPVKDILTVSSLGEYMRN